jgi:multidrug efflux pump
LPAVSIIYAFPLALSQTALEETTEEFRRHAEESGVLERARLISGRGFMGVDGGTRHSDAEISAFLKQYIENRLQPAEFDPDVWLPIVIRDVGTTREKMASVAGWKYSYAQLDYYTDLMGRTLLGVPQASRIERKGVLPQTIYLEYSQERLASSGFQPSSLSNVLNARNITLPGGSLQAGTRSILLDPSGQFEDTASIGNVIVGNSSSGAPVYLRDLAQISRGYQSPAEYLNYYTWTDKSGRSHRSRAITLALYMPLANRFRSSGARWIKS